MLQLVVTGGPDKGRIFNLPNGQSLVIGRGEKSDTKINDPTVSRTHCRIRNQQDQLTVEDLGSSTGTFLNNQDVKSARLSASDIIQIGNTLLRIKLPSDSEQTIIPAHLEPPTAVKPLAELVGTVLGRYNLLEIIGRGNSSLIFKGQDDEKNRLAAVKVLNPSFTANDQQRQRFVRAMKTMLPINDQHIVRLYNAGKTGPYCWLAMELIEGDNLANDIDRIGIDGMMDWKKVWRVAVDIGQALKTGFEHKIIHRNVTPTNILRRHRDGTCVLGDFMFAKALEGTLAEQVTQPGQILGEIPYLAPERTKADADLDTRSDLYGLGATCYALLTGRPPISGDTMSEMIANVRNQIPLPPKKYQLAVDELFQSVVMKLLAKNPDERFADPASMLQELLRIGRFNSL